MAQIGRRAPLQPQADLAGLLEAQVRAVRNDTRLGPGPATTLARRRQRRALEHRLASHVFRHGFHVGQLSTRRAQAAARKVFRAARTTIVHTRRSRSVLLRTSAIDLLPGFKTIRLRHKG